MTKKKTLKDLRRELGISQIDLAKELDMNQSAISKIENGQIISAGYLKYLKFLASKNIDLNSLFYPEKN